MKKSIFLLSLAVFLCSCQSNLETALEYERKKNYTKASKYYLKAAQEKEKEGILDSAAAYYKKAQKEDKAKQLYLQIARNYEKNKDYYKAEQYYKYTDNQDELDAFYLRTAVYYENKKDYIKALSYYELIQDEEKMKESYLQLAKQNEEEKDYLEAINYYSLLEDEENIKRLHLKLAQDYENKGMYKNAIKYYKLAQNEEKIKEIYLIQAIQYEADGQFLEAAQYYNLINFAAQEKEMYLNKAQEYEANGYKKDENGYADEADKLFDKAIEYYEKSDNQEELNNFYLRAANYYKYAGKDYLAKWYYEQAQDYVNYYESHIKDLDEYETIINSYANSDEVKVKELSKEALETCSDNLYELAKQYYKNNNDDISLYSIYLSRLKELNLKANFYLHLNEEEKAKESFLEYLKLAEDEKTTNNAIAAYKKIGETELAYLAYLKQFYYQELLLDYYLKENDKAKTEALYSKLIDKYYGNYYDEIIQFYNNNSNETTQSLVDTFENAKNIITNNATQFYKDTKNQKKLNALYLKQAQCYEKNNWYYDALTYYEIANNKTELKNFYTRAAKHHEKIKAYSKAAFYYSKLNNHTKADQLYYLGAKSTFKDAYDIVTDKSSIDDCKNIKNAKLRNKCYQEFAQAQAQECNGGLFIKEDYCATAGYVYDKFLNNITLAKKHYLLGYKNRDELHLDEFLDFAKKACDRKDKDLCYELAYYKSNFSIHYPTAVLAYTKACELNHYAACNNLGVLYQNPNAVRLIDMKKAVELFKKACNGKDYTACSNLGGMYENGKGVARNYSTAKSYYKKACNGGHNIACRYHNNLEANIINIDNTLILN